MIIKKMVKKILYKFREQEEYWLGRQIIKASKHAAPDFMVIGAAKAGTTSLFQYLAQHPDIITPSTKEIRYFGMGGHKNGLNWYLKHFPTKEKIGDKLTFEATPTYIYKKESPRQIARLYPDMKFILILRDPVKRAFSHWTFYQKHSKIKRMYLIDERTFDMAVDQEISHPENVPDNHRYLSRGMYASQLKRWYQYFDPDQFVIIDFEHFKRDIKSSLNLVTNFLGLKDIYQDFKRTQEKEQGLLEKKDNYNGNSLKTYNVSNYKKKLDPEIEIRLREYFAESDKELTELTGRTFSWMK